MNGPTTEAQAAVVRLIELVAEREGIELGEAGVHINWGESEDMMRGFNTGYDDAEVGKPFGASSSPPADEPWHGAYLRGYQTGWETWHEQQEEEATP